MDGKWAFVAQPLPKRFAVAIGTSFSRVSAQNEARRVHSLTVETSADTSADNQIVLEFRIAMAFKYK